MGADDLDVRVVLLQRLAHSHYRTGRAQGRDEVVQLTTCLPPDLVARGLVMGHLVVLVRELVRHEILVRIHLDKLPRLPYGTVSAVLPLAQGHGPAERLDHLPPLHGDGLAHDNLHFIAFDRTYHGQGHSGVAGCRLDDGLAPGERPLLLRLLDHAQGDPVLDAAGGIEAFHLGVDGSVPVGIELVDLDQWRVADRLEDIVPEISCWRFHVRFSGSGGRAFIIDIVQVGSIIEGEVVDAVNV